MRGTTDWDAEMAALDARIAPFAERPIDISGPKWGEKLLRAVGGVHPVDEAGVRPELESFVMRLVASYGDASAEERARFRESFRRFPSLAWSARVPLPPDSEDRVRAHLLLFSIEDQERDPRDASDFLKDLLDGARAAGVNVAPILREVAQLSSDEDRFRCGSTRDWLLRAC